MATAKKGLGRGLLVLLTVGSLLLGAAVVAGVLFFDSFARTKVIEEARKRGVEIDPADVDVWFGSATIEDSTFKLIGVEGISGHFDRVSVLLTDWKPNRIDAEHVTISVVGSAADLMLGIAQWTNAHPLGYRVPASAKEVALTWKPTAESAPWLAVQGGQIAGSESGSIFSAQQASFAGVDVGAVGASWAAEGQTVRMAFGSSDAENAPVRAEVFYGESPAKVRVELRPTNLTALAGPLGVALPLEGVAVRGQADFTLPEGFGAGPVAGHLHGDLIGYVPPHPVELNGFVFGDRTTLDTAFSLSPDATLVTLTDTEVTAGKFKLQGGGKIERQEEHAIIRMELTGNLSCREVASAAAQARIGSVLGRLLGKAARKVMTGSVGVRVAILADTRNLPAAEVQRHIGVGCGLKPITLEELIELGLSDEAKDVLDQLPAAAAEIPEIVRKNLPGMPSGLPALPSGLPPLPSTLPPIPSRLPPFPFELSKPKSKKNATEPEASE